MTDNLPATTSPLERVLNDPGALERIDADKLEKLFELHLRHEAEIARRAYAEAFLAVQQEMQPVKKQGKIKNRDGQVQSIYAKAEDVCAMLDPLLLKNGFSTSTSSAPHPQEGWTRFCLIVRHVGGHEDKFYMDGPIDSTGIKGNPVKTALQGMASSFTFCERVLLIKAFRVATIGEDKDGNAVRGAAKITEKQGQTIEDLLAETGVDRTKFLGWLEVEQLADLPQGRYQRAVAELEKRLKGA